MLYALDVMLERGHLYQAVLRSLRVTCVMQARGRLLFSLPQTQYAIFALRVNFLLIVGLVSIHVVNVGLVRGLPRHRELAINVMPEHFRLQLQRPQISSAYLAQAVQYQPPAL